MLVYCADIFLDRFDLDGDLFYLARGFLHFDHLFLLLVEVDYLLFELFDCVLLVVELFSLVI